MKPEHEEGKLPPHAADLEQVILGACLVEPECVDLVMGILHPKCFYVRANELVFEAIEALYERSHAIDLLTVTQELRSMRVLEDVGGAFYVSQLTNQVASSANVEYHARIVQQCWAKREVIRIAAQVTRSGYDHAEDVFDLIDGADNSLQALTDVLGSRGSLTIAQVASEFMEGLERDPKPRHSTGLAALDKQLGGGWTNGELAILAGRPGMGKTSAALSMVYSSAKAGHATGLFSMEIGQERTNLRMVSIGTGIPMAVLSRGKGMSADDLKAVHEHHGIYTKLPVVCNFSSALTLSEIRSEARRMKRANKVTAIIIDQLGWILPPHGVRDPVGAITRGLKRIASDLDIPVVVLHQLSRATTARPDKVPQLTDLRESGAAEQDAQVVVFVHRPEYYNIMDDEHGSTRGMADLIVAKNSNGPTGVARVRFEAQCTKFSDLISGEAKEAEPEPETPTDPLPF